ncbi:MAG: cytochrome c maturation protein CcmE [Bacteroidetes bacterium]|nr:cytochrome c maturation protein CcmE [Bacteroidota bacterium]
MKKMHIILLVVIAAVIAGLLTWMKDLSTYDTVASARRKDGRFVHLIARLDRSAPVVYDPIKDPNFLSFHALDSLGQRTQVVYRNAKPVDLERSERVVMKGRMQGEIFECSEIVLKCPSKYTEDPGVQMRRYEGAGSDTAAALLGS